MNLLVLGRTRLKIDIRLERVSPDADELERRRLSRQAMAMSLAERERWETLHFSQVNRIH